MSTRGGRSILRGSLVRLILDSPGACGRAGTERLLGRVRSVGPKRSGPVIAMHVRRGDACMRWAQEGDGSLPNGRPCYKMTVMMDAARRLRRQYGADRIFIATDSECVIRHELPKYSDEFQFSYLDFNRTTAAGSMNARGCDADDFSDRHWAEEGGDEPYFVENRQLDMIERTLCSPRCMRICSSCRARICSLARS